MSSWAATSKLLVFAWRDSRQSRWRFFLFISSLAIGVGALVAIDSFSENERVAVREQSRALLGGDVRLAGRATHLAELQPVIDSLRAAGATVAALTTTQTMLFGGRSGTARLVEMTGLSREYPVAGIILTAPASAWTHLQDGRSIVVTQSVLDALALKVGDSVQTGLGRFAITGVLVRQPGDVEASMSATPPVFVARSALDTLERSGMNARADGQLLLALPSSMQVGPVTRRLRALTERQAISVRTYGQTESSIGRDIAELSEYLALAGLAALFLGGVGVASAVTSHVKRRIDTVAILRCVGATSSQILAVYIAQSVVMGITGAVFGALTGIAIQFVAPWLLRDLIPFDVRVQIVPRALAEGLIAGCWFAIVFALYPVIALRRVSPLQVLRRDADTLALGSTRADALRLSIALLVLTSVITESVTRASTVRAGLGYAAMIGFTIAALWLSASLLMWLARMFSRPSLPFAVRHAVANLHRSGSQARMVVVGLGFGTFLIGGVSQVERGLFDRSTAALREMRSNLIFADVADDQRAPLDSMIRAHGQVVAQTAAILHPRLVAIDAIPADTMLKQRTRPAQFRRMLRFKMRGDVLAIATREPLPSDQVLFGTSHLGERNGEVSIGRLYEASVTPWMRFAFGIRLGDTLTWDADGVPFRTRVTSVSRPLQTLYGTQPDLVVDERALSGVQKHYILGAAVKDPRAIAPLQSAAAAAFPSVISIDLQLQHDVITHAYDLIRRALRLISLLSLLLAIPVLFSAVSASRRERLREGQILKVLGATRRQVASMMLTEYLILGLLSATTGTALSFLAAWQFMTRVYDEPYAIAGRPAAEIALLMTCIAVAVGMLASREIFSTTAATALRDDR